MEDLRIAEEEQVSEAVSSEQLWYEIDPETVEGAGAESIEPSSILKMGQEERDKWIQSMSDELESLTRLGVKEDLTPGYAL